MVNSGNASIILSRFLISSRLNCFAGAGSGINASANALVLNTYFKEKRRIATGLAWTITGMGPIIMPQIIAVVMPLYGVEGTLWLYTGLALVAAACAMLYQPVQWHTQKKDTDEQLVEGSPPAVECDYCAMLRGKNKSVFSSQYLYNSDNANVTGYEIIDPATPMLPQANDGWSSRHSSRTSSRFGSRIASSHNLVGSNRPSSANLSAFSKDRVSRKISEIKIDEHPEVDVNGSVKGPYECLLTPITPPNVPTVQVQPAEGDIGVAKTPYRKISHINTFNIEKEVLKGASQKLEEYVNKKKSPKRKKHYRSLENFCTCDDLRRFHADTKLSELPAEEHAPDEKQHFTIWQKIAVFFDLDLLRDLTYCNLMMGVTLGNFAELNFSILTPFVLDDWGMDKRQIATAMSLLGGVDISVRFFIPFMAGKIGWENKTFFLIGILGMAMGRICKLFSHQTEFDRLTLFLSCSYNLLPFVHLHTDCICLDRPGQGTADRLHGAGHPELRAAGQTAGCLGASAFVRWNRLLCDGTGRRYVPNHFRSYHKLSKISSALGLIRDRTNYIVTLHSLNIATFFVATCWIFEKIYRDRHDKKKLSSGSQT